MRAWLTFVVAVVFIGAAYFADQFVRDAMRQAQANFNSRGAETLDLLARVGTVVALLGLSWLVYRAPRSRLVGLAMIAVGFYVGLVPELSFVVLANTGFSTPPLVFEILTTTSQGGPLTWLATSVMVLGFVELLRPSPVVRRADDRAVADVEPAEGTDE